MRFELTEDQDLFRSTTRRFLDATSTLTAVRALEQDPDGFDRAWWRRGADLGWTSMLVPEADGGGSVSGDGLLDLVLVAEEMGRVVAPGPLIPTSVVADTLSRAGTPKQRAAVLPGIVAGDLVAAWCISGPARVCDPHHVLPDVSVDNGRLVLTGVMSPVEAAGQADIFLVTVRVDGALTQLLIPAGTPGLSVSPMEGIDFTRRFGTVHLDGVVVQAADAVGQIGGAAADVERQLQVAVVLQSAETVGALDAVFERTLEYLGDRFSFGRPLSSYQALKHRLADLKLWLEACHGTATAAAESVQLEDPSAAETVSACKQYIGWFGSEMVQDCVQLHGGIGVTWEHDLHLYLRRVALHRSTYGTPTEHGERIVAGLGLEGKADAERR